MTTQRQTAANLPTADLAHLLRGMAKDAAVLRPMGAALIAEAADRLDTPEPGTRGREPVDGDRGSAR